MAFNKKEALKTEDTQLYDYELVFIVSPEVADEALETAIENVSQFIIGKKGSISDIARWGKRRLAYPIKRSLEGNYVLTRLRMSPRGCKELEANLQISEEILRHLLIRLEKVSS